jgi:hypothetical protein
MTISFHTDEITEVIEGPHLDGPGLFADRIAAEFAYSLRHGVPLTLIVIEPRHVAEVLALSDPVWRDSVRKSDVVARIDKRRIAVIAPRTPAQMAQKIVARLRESVRGAMRIGLVTQTPSNTFEGPGAMLRAAEFALR